jgi:hypothetical protein
MKTVLLVSALALALGGCSVLRTNIIGGCELPATLAAKDKVDDLPTDHDLSIIEQRQLWAKDRKHLKQSVDHGNATVDYVAGHCQ